MDTASSPRPPLRLLAETLRWRAASPPSRISRRRLLLRLLRQCARVRADVVER